MKGHGCNEGRVYVYEEAYSWYLDFPGFWRQWFLDIVGIAENVNMRRLGILTTGLSTICMLHMIVIGEGYKPISSKNDECNVGIGGSRVIFFVQSNTRETPVVPL